MREKITSLRKANAYNVDWRSFLESGKGNHEKIKNRI